MIQAQLGISMASPTRRHHRQRRPRAAAVLSRFPSRPIDQSTVASIRGSKNRRYFTGCVSSLRKFTEESASARRLRSWERGERERDRERNRESAKRAATLAAIMDFGASEALERESFPLPIARLLVRYRSSAARRRPRLFKRLRYALL